MDESGAVYYTFSTHPNPSQDTVQAQGSDLKRCSVRGCTQYVTNGSTNKMCDVCRGRHRIYATTKRARRKMEKAAVANAVAARNGTEPLMLIHEAESASTQPQSGVAHQPIWGATSQFMPQENSLPNSQSLTTVHSAVSSSSFANATWDHAIDPSLLAAREAASSLMHPVYSHHQTSSTSELANALTLPPPRIKPPVAQVPVQPQVDRQEGCSSFPMSQVSAQDKQPSGSNDGLNMTQMSTQEAESKPTRFCSVKGCKAVIPGSYEFKMCPPCRVRYRTYGTTKRAKWKYEREAFEREMTNLRMQEDEKRKARGLGPLSDNPEELRTWELSIIDEQVPLPVVGKPPPMGALAGSMAVESTFGVDANATVLAGSGYSASSAMNSIDSVHSISPYPHLNHPTLGAVVAPLPARMCTVSHCHKILPGYYRYKRCEQHRLQNRYHSKLKRVREKEVKSAGPEEGAQPLDIAPKTAEADGSEVGGGDQAMNVKQKSKRDPSVRRPRKERKDKGMKKVKLDESMEGHLEPHASGIEAAAAGTVVGDAQETVFIPEVKPLETESKSAKTKNEAHSRFSCATSECHNLLTPGVRWRTCEDCRSIERKRKFQVRAELKAAENVYWRNVSEKMSLARQAGANASKMSAVNEPVASGSGTGAVETEECCMDGMGDDVDADADADHDVDADGEGDTDNGEDIPIQSLPIGEAPMEASQSQNRPLIWKTAKTDAPPSWSGGFSKFRVEIPPTPPPLPTAEELMKMDDPAFRAFKPKTTPSAVGRLLARNPQISVDAFSEILEAGGSNHADVPTSEGGDTIAAENSVSIPTPTIPTSEPFVYKAPEKRTATDEPSTSGKGKRKVTSDDIANSIINTPAHAPPAPPSASYTPPYGFPPSYPYYPYYMPPYHMPAYPYPPHLALASSASKGPTTSGMPAAGAPPGYFPYPYPQPYGFTPPAGIPYLSPRYPAPAYGQPSAQHPYASLPPGTSTAQGFSYYVPAASTSAAAATASVIPTVSTPVPAPRAPSAKLPIRKDGQFSYYQHNVGHSDSPTDLPPNKKKRLKADPNYLEKFASQGNHDEPDLVHSQIGHNSGASIPITMASAAAPDEASVTDADVDKEGEGEQSNVVEESSSALPRSCATKTCQRTIPATSHGTICEKCKLRFKKHQARAKQKYKLEPRKFLQTRNAMGMEDHVSERSEHTMGHDVSS